MFAFVNNILLEHRHIYSYITNGYYYAVIAEVIEFLVLSQIIGHHMIRNLLLISDIIVLYIQYDINILPKIP